MTLATFNASIAGTRPLIMHSARLADPLDEMTVEKARFTKKRNKTVDDLREIGRLEWLGGVYHEDGRVVVPEANLIACIGEAGRLRKLGRQVKMASFSFDSPAFPLVYDGPKDLDSASKDARLIYRRVLRQGPSRIVRVRPRFFPWSVDFSGTFNPEVLDPRVLKDLLLDAGALIGLGDERPAKGRFEVRLLEIDGKRLINEKEAA